VSRPRFLGSGVGYDAVIAGARHATSMFEASWARELRQNDGRKGLHVCLPIVPTWTGPQAKISAAASPGRGQERAELYGRPQSKQRRGKTSSTTCATPAAPLHRPVFDAREEKTRAACPLEWDELSPKLPPDHFTLRHIEARLAKLNAHRSSGWPELKQRLTGRPNLVSEARNRVGRHG